MFQLYQFDQNKIAMLILSRQFLEYFVLRPNYHLNNKIKNVTFIFFQIKD